MPRQLFHWFWVGSVMSIAVSTALAAISLPHRTWQTSPIILRPLKPRAPLAKGDRWRVRVSQYLMQLPEPEWTPPDTWLFAVPGLEKTREGQRFIVTATREGASK